jgi:hypothetical protein
LTEHKFQILENECYRLKYIGGGGERNGGSNKIRNSVVYRSPDIVKAVIPYIKEINPFTARMISNYQYPLC